MRYPHHASLPIVAALAVLFLLSREARAEQPNCSPNQAVYARDDGSEFIVRHVGIDHSNGSGTRHLEGELIGQESREEVVFSTNERSSLPEVVGRFMQLGADWERLARYRIKWIEKSTDGVVTLTRV
jgi:hypothetical protein